MPTHPASLTGWLHDPNTPTPNSQVGIRLLYRDARLPVARFRNRAQNVYVAQICVIAMFGYNPFIFVADGPTLFESEGGKYEFFRPHSIATKE